MPLLKLVKSDQSIDNVAIAHEHHFLRTAFEGIVEDKHQPLNNGDVLHQLPLLHPRMTEYCPQEHPSNQ